MNIDFSDIFLLMWYLHMFTKLIFIKFAKLSTFFMNKARIKIKIVHSKTSNLI